MPERDTDLFQIGIRQMPEHRNINIVLGKPLHVLPEVEPKPQDAAERRQVTVMFSDLVGSTALSARMDPEDLREVISAYQKCVADTVRRFGGFVAKYMGDGVSCISSRNGIVLVRWRGLFQAFGCSETVHGS